MSTDIIMKTCADPNDRQVDVANNQSNIRLPMESPFISAILLLCTLSTSSAFAAFKKKEAPQSITSSQSATERVKMERMGLGLTTIETVVGSDLTPFSGWIDFNAASSLQIIFGIA